MNKPMTTTPLVPMSIHPIPALKDWQKAAGGTHAATGRDSFKLASEKGEYYIDPICFPKTNSHRGYIVKFADTKGLLKTGLWHWLEQNGIANNVPQPCMCLNDAVKACRVHFDAIQVNPVAPEQVIDAAKKAS